MTPPPFSRPISVDLVPKDGLARDIEANAQERAGLAALNGLPAIASLAASLNVRRVGKGGFEVSGQVRARATQTCVVTLEPFEVEIAEPVAARFASPREPIPPRSAVAKRAPAEPEPPNVDVDAPDTIMDGVIDLGAVAAEFFALALDPYPRKPGAVFAPPS